MTCVSSVSFWKGDVACGDWMKADGISNRMVMGLPNRVKRVGPVLFGLIFWVVG